MSNIVSIARNHNKIFLGTYQYFMYISISPISALHLCSWCHGLSELKILTLALGYWCCLCWRVVCDMHWSIHSIFIGKFSISHKFSEAWRNPYIGWVEQWVAQHKSVFLEFSWGVHVCRWNWSFEEFSHSLNPTKAHYVSWRWALSTSASSSWR